MREFFKNKLNLTLVVLIGASLIGVLISSFWEPFVPISCILFGILSIFVGALFFKKYIENKKNRTDEFISQEDKLKRKTTRFLENESKMNTIMLAVLFVAMGGILIFYALKVFGL
jgi:hypothetical protein